MQFHAISTLQNHVAPPKSSPQTTAMLFLMLACSPTFHLRGTHARQRAFMNLLTVQLYHPRANMPSSSIVHSHSISQSTSFGSDCNASFQDMPRCFSRCVPFLVFPCGGLCVLGLGFLMFSCCAQLSQNWWKLLVPRFAPCFVVRVLWNAVEMARYLCLLASGYITYLYCTYFTYLHFLSGTK